MNVRSYGSGNIPGVQLHLSDLGFIAAHSFEVCHGPFGLNRAGWGVRVSASITSILTFSIFQVKVVAHVVIPAPIRRFHSSKLSKGSTESCFLLLPDCT